MFMFDHLSFFLYKIKILFSFLYSWWLSSLELLQKIIYIFQFIENKILIWLLFLSNHRCFVSEN